MVKRPSNIYYLIFLNRDRLIIGRLETRISICPKTNDCIGWNECCNKIWLGMQKWK